MIKMLKMMRLKDAMTPRADDAPDDADKKIKRYEDKDMLMTA